MGRVELLPLLKRLMVERLPPITRDPLLRVNHAVAPDADTHHVAGLHRSVKRLWIVEMLAEFFARPRDRVTAPDMLRDAIAVDALNAAREMRSGTNGLLHAVAFDVKLRGLGTPGAAANTGLQLCELLVRHIGRP